MKNLFIFSFLLVYFSINIYAQNFNLSELMRNNFNYDTLYNLTCKQVPSGIFGIKFKIDKKGFASNFICSNDSLLALNLLFTTSIEKSLAIKAKEHSKLKSGNYFQLIYFRNIAHCKDFWPKNGIYMDTSEANFSKRNDKEMIYALNKIQEEMEKSWFNLQQTFFSDSTQIILTPAFITETKPLRKYHRRVDADY